MWAFGASGFLTFFGFRWFDEVCSALPDFWLSLISLARGCSALPDLSFGIRWFE
jgi:hypothetical protein